MFSLVIVQLIGLVAGSRVDGDDPLGTPESVFFGLLLPIGLGAVVVLAFAASIGWLRELFGPQPIRGSWWMWILPVVVLLFNALRFAAADYNSYDAVTVVLVLVLGLCIGVVEEVLTRGLAVTLLRRAGYREIAVALISSAIFAALHLVNLVSGMTPQTVLLTVGYAFFFGIAMYFTLRVTGNLIWPVLLHASTDASLFLLSGGIDTVGENGAQSNLATVAGLANVVIIALGVVLVWFIRGRVAASRPA